MYACTIIPLYLQPQHTLLCTIVFQCTGFGSVNVHLSMDSVEEEQCDMRICGQRY